MVSKVFLAALLLGNALLSGAQVHPLDSSSFRPGTGRFDFLNPLIEGKRIVFLGEEHHQVAEFNTLKTGIVQYLQRQHGFSVLLFESPAAEAFYGFADPASFRDSGRLLPPRVLNRFWLVAENKPLLRPPAGSGDERPLLIGGMDPQYAAAVPSSSGRFPNPFAEGIRQAPFLSDTVRQTLLRLDSVENDLFVRFGEHLSKTGRADKQTLIFDVPGESSAFYGAAAACEAGYAACLGTTSFPDNRGGRLFRLFLHNRRWMCRRFMTPGNYDFSRDSMMAWNICYLADSVFPGERIIVWAHDEHIARTDMHTYWNRSSIGNYLPGPFQAGTCVLAFKMRTRFPPDGPPEEKKGLRATLQGDLDKIGPAYFLGTAAGKKAGLIRSWYSKTYLHAVQTTYPASFDPEALYDGVFYVREVHAPHY